MKKPIVGLREKNFYSNETVIDVLAYANHDDYDMIAYDNRDIKEAYEEMIDALIVALDTIEEVCDPEVFYPERELNQIEQALKKGGCEL